MRTTRRDGLDWHAKEDTSKSFHLSEVARAPVPVQEPSIQSSWKRRGQPLKGPTVPPAHRHRRDHCEEVVALDYLQVI